MIKRQILGDMDRWQSQKTRKPLLMLGARQVGKTTLIRHFGNLRFTKLHEINFEERGDLRAVFHRDLDPLRILSELSVSLKTPIDSNRDLLFFDEIQLCPEALTSLKYFNDKVPELAVIGAGSLLGVALHEASFPVGKVQRLDLHPINFEEYLEATKQHEYYKDLEQYLNRGEVPSVLHQQLWDALKSYLITGGLPEIVSAALQYGGDDVSRCQGIRQSQKSLIRDYIADMAKHSGKANAMHLQRVFHAVAEQVSAVQDGSIQRFRFSGAVPGISQYSRLTNTFDWLINAGLVIKSPVVQQIAIPLSSQTKESLFKAFIFDVGILGALANLDPLAIMSYDFGSYKGFLVENYVAVELVTQGMEPLFNWAGRESEIEFLLETKNEIVPVEVKSGIRTRSRSLKEYISRYHPKNSIILSAKPQFFVSNSKDSPSMAPLYAAPKIGKLLAR